MTIRERVKVIQVAFRDGASPEQVRDGVLQLTALLGNVNDELRTADLEYKRVLLKAFQTEETANRAKICAETSPEYERARTAKDTRELVVEMIRSGKAYLRSLDEEMRLQS